MDLILWRHAEAEDGFPDAERKLTEKGFDQAKRMSNCLRSKLPKNTLMLVSPTRRTQQTAMALSSNFVTSSEIGPGTNVDTVLNLINWPNMRGAVIIVGHQPVLGKIINSLISKISLELDIKKGSVWWIKYQVRDNIAETVLHTVIYPEAL